MSVHNKKRSPKPKARTLLSILYARKELARKSGDDKNYKAYDEAIKRREGKR